MGLIWFEKRGRRISQFTDRRCTWSVGVPDVAQHVEAPSLRPQWVQCVGARLEGGQVFEGVHLSVFLVRHG